ncbi:hypothetical protein Asch01_00353 [Acinetobacter schindleri]|uniref:TIGR02391 family protein n=1 Tax=Acinetobacter schindleri TaxID=108981 RepID=UPI0030A89AC8
MMFNLFNRPSEEIQYLGTPYTQDCIEAIGFLLQTQQYLEKVLLLSYEYQYAYVIQTNRSTYAIRSGFSTDSGEASKGLASSLQLFLKHNIDLEEVKISKKILKKLNQASLSDLDLDNILKAQCVRPIQRYEYIYSIYKTTDYQHYNDRYYPETLPFHLIDTRIFDLALKFHDDPNYSILTAYTRLEDIVKVKINDHSLFSNNLLKTAFISDKQRKSIYSWNTNNENVSNALGCLFTNVFTAYRNERAHSEVDKPYSQQIREFLLINELYLLESEAIKR